MATKAIALHAPAGGGQGGAAPPNLTHAALELYEATPVGGGSKPGASIDRIPFQFNPKELSISKSAKWERDERARRRRPPARRSSTARTPAS